jgi:hypothetical protein
MLDFFRGLRWPTENSGCGPDRELGDPPEEKPQRTVIHGRKPGDVVEASTSPQHREGASARRPPRLLPRARALPPGPVGGDAPLEPPCGNPHAGTARGTARGTAEGAKTRARRPGRKLRGGRPGGVRGTSREVDFPSPGGQRTRAPTRARIGTQIRARIPETGLSAPSSRPPRHPLGDIPRSSHIAHRRRRRVREGAVRRIGPDRPTEQPGRPTPRPAGRSAPVRRLNDTESTEVEEEAGTPRNARRNEGFGVTTGAR